MDNKPICNDNSEQQLFLRQKLDVIGQLAGGISHNFNNQLTGIMGFANLIRMRSNEESIKKFADEIINICKNSGDMVRELLTFARYKPVTTAGVDVNGIVMTITHLLSNSIDKKIVINQELCEKRCLVMTDAIQFESALLNLALNSKDAMPQGGDITFTTRHIDGESGNFVVIEVADTGNGMTDDVKAHVFEPFFTTKGEGHVGLGLAAAYRLVQSMNGTIGISSEEGKGTTVTVKLPTCCADDSGERHKPQVSDMGGNLPAAFDNGDANTKECKGTILLADDDNGIRESISAFLRNVGYSVFTANDGLDAVEKYTNTHKAIDLVILDMVMPRMDGKDAFVKMKGINPGIKAICITGFNRYAPETLTGLGIKTILHKPFSFEDLKATVAKYIC